MMGSAATAEAVAAAIESVQRGGAMRFELGLRAIAAALFAAAWVGG
jgi:hypothetical protein